MTTDVVQRNAAAFIAYRNQRRGDPNPSKQLSGKRGPSPKLISFRGQALTLREWAEQLGITVNALHQRIHRAGSFEGAMLVSQSRRHRAVPHDFPEDLGTGAGSVARHFPQLEFSE